MSRDLLPFQSRFIEIDGQRMHYIDEGTGPVVLALHGNPTWCYYYRNLVAALRTKYRVIAPDHIGCGLSDHPTNKHYRARDRVNHLKALIQQLGIERYSLVMHDWGGPIGAALAADNLAVVEKIVFLNTTLTETESLPPIIKWAAHPLVGKFLTKYSRRFVKLTTDWGVARKLPKDVRRAYHYPYRSIARRTAIWDFVDDIPFNSDHPTYPEMLSIAESLPRFHGIPIQIIWGLKDPCFHREMLTKIARHFPRAHVLEIPNASHLVLEDAPELVISTIERFLEADEKHTDATLNGREVTGRTVNDQDVDDQDGPGMRENAVRGGAPAASPTLLSALSEIARKHPFADAAITPRSVGNWMTYEHTNFSDLLALVYRYQRGLNTQGLRYGDKVLMLVTPGVNFLALTYAVMAHGAIPIFIDPGIDRKFLFACIHDLKPDVMIGTHKAQLLRWVRRKDFEALKFSVIAHEYSFLRGPNLSDLKKYSSYPPLPLRRNDIAMIAFTSGATGKPKGVVFTQEMVQAQLAIFRSFGFEAGCRDLPLLPIFSIFTVPLGVGSVFAPLNPSKPLALDPSKITRMISDLNIQFSFGSPTLWRKIGEYCVRTGLTLASLKAIFMAGAPVPIATIETVKRIIPQGECYTPYGATEALPVTRIAGEEILRANLKPANSGGQGTLVGKPVAGVQIKIMQSQDGPVERFTEVQELSAGEIGEIIVTGVSVSPRYYMREDADQMSKIADGARVWHRMGDVGYLDTEGNLYFCGRKAHMVKSADRTYYSIPVERVFNQHPRVHRSALVDLSEGVPAIVVEPTPSSWPRDPLAQDAFRNELKELARTSPLTTEIETIYFHPSFPVDRRHNAKIFRDKLGAWARERKA